MEKYLDKPRHVETQCLADQDGNVVVVSTRDCSLQRRHQKLVEEAPAPFLTEEQTRLLYESSKAILKEVGYVGAGTCEFLIGQDGTVSFLTTIPGFTGLEFVVGSGSDKRTLVFRDAQHEYTFTEK